MQFYWSKTQQKLGHTSLKQRFLSVFDVFENSVDCSFWKSCFDVVSLLLDRALVYLGDPSYKTRNYSPESSFPSSLTARDGAKSVHWMGHWGSFCLCKSDEKVLKMHFFWKSAAISAFFEKNIKIAKSPYKRAFVVVQNSKKLGHTSLKWRFLSCFDAFWKFWID